MNRPGQGPDVSDATAPLHQGLGVGGLGAGHGEDVAAAVKRGEGRGLGEGGAQGRGGQEQAEGQRRAAPKDGTQS